MDGRELVVLATKRVLQTRVTPFSYFLFYVTANISVNFS
jgi:hypothetical protein